jgi:lipopolysaccharide/colanic/teichoic acid biosynthesis glycosyltransferase
MADYTLSKRIFDVFFVLLTAPLTLPLGMIISGLVLLKEGRPLFFSARRVGHHGRAFNVLKFRTMQGIDSERAGVSGGHSSVLISPFAARLRKYRLDELPQLWNVLRGDMGLVGPRPTDPRYVALYPELYAKIYELKPGLTGLATLYMHRVEDRILGDCSSPEEAEQLYCRRCIPRKAQFDLVYHDYVRQHGAICFDTVILWKTLCAVFIGKT